MHARAAVLLLLLPALLPTINAAESPVAAPAEPTWQAVMADGRKVGHVERSRRFQDDLLLDTTRLTLELGAPGRRFTYRVRVEASSTPDGVLTRLVRESRTREGHTLIDARMNGADLHVDVGAGKVKRILPDVGTLHADEYLRRWLRHPDRAETLAYRTFDSARLAVAEIEVTRLTSEPPWRVRRLMRVAGAESETILLFDAQGNVIDEAMSLGGIALRLVAATQSEALARNQVLDHVVGQLQKSPYRIPAREMRAKIRYGFDHRGTPRTLPTGGGQRSWSDDRLTWIQVCASCAPDAVSLDDAERARHLSATPWLNFEDSALSARATRAAGGAVDAAHRMRRLTAFVRGHMNTERIDMLGYGSALEAYRSRRGDCTEYAVLLAAMGRAAGVPTRVVSGLVYARQFEKQRHVFVPHAWVQAWTGTGWESFDAALGAFDSTHLAFAVSHDGNPAQLFAGINLAHELELRSAARVVPRESAASP